jgi:hypothetical protein
VPKSVSKSVFVGERLDDVSTAWAKQCSPAAVTKTLLVDIRSRGQGAVATAAGPTICGQAVDSTILMTDILRPASDR